MEPQVDACPTIQKVTSTLWPSFLVAIVATAATFSFFDPEEVLIATGGPELSRLGAYTVGFFLFWFWCALSSAMSCYFIRCKVPPRIQLPDPENDE